MRWIKWIWDHFEYYSILCSFFGHDHWVSLHLKDDGAGNLVGSGGRGKIDHKTGEIEVEGDQQPCRRCGREAPEPKRFES